MSSLMRIVAVLLFLLVLVTGIQFAAVNAAPVAVNYFLGTLSLPLSLVVVCAFAAGVVVTLAVGAFTVLGLRWRTAGLKREVAARQHELERLRQTAHKA